MVSLVFRAHHDLAEVKPFTEVFAPDRALDRREPVARHHDGQLRRIIADDPVLLFREQDAERLSCADADDAGTAPGCVSVEELEGAPV